jgi:prepilin-type N-terminal cleavage/methylation domain-containing protein
VSYRKPLQFHHRYLSRRGFTLIELLVVIAIIAILAALIFPAFSRAQESAREGNTMSHLHDIGAGLALYKLDNKAYPPVLFAYACDTKANAIDGCTTADSMATIASDPNAKNELVGLYPEYVRDYHEFINVNDPQNDNATNEGLTVGANGNQPQPNYLNPGGYLQTPDGTALYPYRAYFQMDSFDVNPLVTGANQIEDPNVSTNYIIRYQTSWTGFDQNYGTTGDTTPFAANYTRQLRWANPPANTYVTAVTYHVPNANKLIVLYDDGSAYKVDYSPGTGANQWDEASSPSIAVTTTASTDNASPAQFWTFDATGH